MDCSLPGSSVHGIFQARVLEWGAIAFSGYADDITLMAESKEKLKSFLMNVKESEKAGLNLNIQKIKNQRKLLCQTSSGEGNGTPLQYSCLENRMDRGAW